MKQEPKIKFWLLVSKRKEKRSTLLKIEVCGFTSWEKKAPPNNGGGGRSIGGKEKKKRHISDLLRWVPFYLVSVLEALERCRDASAAIDHLGR